MKALPTTALLISVASALWSSGIVAALIPALVPPANKQGNGNLFQLSTGSTTTNDCVKFDANGNTVDSSAACITAVSAGCGITISGSTVSWNPADVKTCIGLWEPYWGYTGVGGTTSCGTAFDHTRIVATGTWTTTCDADPTTYNNTLASHIGVVKHAAPNTAAPSMSWVPNFSNALFSVFTTDTEWTIVSVFLLSDVTNTRTWFGWSNSSTGAISGSASGIYWRFDVGVPDTHAQAELCNASTCTAIDLGAAPSVGWQSVVIRRQTTGIANPTITVTWNGTPVTYCSSGCTAVDTNAPGNTVQQYLSSQFAVNGTHSGIFWEIDTDALFFTNLGIP